MPFPLGTFTVSSLYHVANIDGISDRKLYVVCHLKKSVVIQVYVLQILVYSVNFGKVLLLPLTALLLGLTTPYFHIVFTIPTALYHVYFIHIYVRTQRIQNICLTKKMHATC